MTTVDDITEGDIIKWYRNWTWTHIYNAQSKEQHEAGENKDADILYEDFKPYYDSSRVSCIESYPAKIKNKIHVESAIANMAISIAYMDLKKRIKSGTVTPKIIERLKKEKQRNLVCAEDPSYDPEIGMWWKPLDIDI